MSRSLFCCLSLSAAVALAGPAGAQNQAASGVPGARDAEPSQGFIVAIPPTNAAAAATIAEEKPVQHIPPTEVRGVRDTQAPCDPAQGRGQEACRAQLAAKYAAMDKLCRSVSSVEFPVCIKSAYAPD
jgi:hypothetical protein